MITTIVQNSLLILGTMYCMLHYLLISLKRFSPRLIQTACEQEVIEIDFVTAG